MIKVTNKIFKGLGNKARISIEQSKKQELHPFYGSYYGQAVLKYITTDLLGDFIDFPEEEDVLFLYNARILNNSTMFK